MVVNPLIETSCKLPTLTLCYKLAFLTVPLIRQTRPTKHNTDCSSEGNTWSYLTEVTCSQWVLRSLHHSSWSLQESCLFVHVCVFFLMVGDLWWCVWYDVWNCVDLYKCCHWLKLWCFLTLRAQCCTNDQPSDSGMCLKSLDVFIICIQVCDLKWINVVL